jgi:CheY-like chemotaxis protein
MSTRHVLIVDDLHDIRQLLRSSLESLKLDINIVDVPSGEEAMLVISRQKYDLLVSDVRLAGISGLDLVSKVRKGNPKLKVILITGMTDSEIRQQVADFGADQYFFKPIDILEFQNAVVSFLDFDSVQLPEPPPMRSEPAHPAASLPDQLNQLLTDLRAGCVWVADSSGSTILKVGEIPGILEPLDRKSNLSAANAASLEVSRLLQREFPENYLFVSGLDHDLHAISLGWMYTLMVTVPHGIETSPSAAMQVLSQRSAQVLNALAEFLVHVAQSELDEGIKPGETDELPDSAQETAELDEVFNHAGSGGLGSQEIDDYWDSLAEQQDHGEQTDSGALSYEQARRLGLTPGE